MSIIEFKNISKEYGKGEAKIKALDQVSFELEKGKLAVILGPSGSGKSTMLNLLGGMDYCSEGSICVGGKMISNFSERQLTEYRRNYIGFVFQFYNLIPNLTAYENVDITARLSKSGISAKESLMAVNLLKRANHFPSELSGGELQRVSIARAICKNPEVFLCDEPTGALDSETGKKILMILQKMAKEKGKTVIIVTHNASIAPAADQVLKLKDGKIEEILDNTHPLSMEEVNW